jgi:hypothetical protein
VRSEEYFLQDSAVPGWHYEVLAARETDLLAGNEHFSDWESAKELIRETV